MIYGDCEAPAFTRTDPCAAAPAANTSEGGIAVVRRIRHAILILPAAVTMFPAARMPRPLEAASDPKDRELASAAPPCRRAATPAPTLRTEPPHSRRPVKNAVHPDGVFDVGRSFLKKGSRPALRQGLGLQLPHEGVLSIAVALDIIGEPRRQSPL